MTALELLSGAAGGFVGGFLAVWLRTWRLHQTTVAAQNATAAALEGARMAWDGLESCEGAVRAMASEREHFARSIAAIGREHGVTLPERRGDR